MDPQIMTHIVFALAAAFCMGVGSLATAFAQGKAVASALESIARQPQMAGELRLSMIIGLAMIESLAIYCLLVSLALLFVKW